MAITLPTAVETYPWEKMDNALRQVKERLERVTAILEAKNIPYAVIGGNAVAAWVGEIDESLVRNTRDVDLLVQRSDLETLKTALEAAGFIYRRVAILGGKAHIDMFLDGKGAKARDGVHLIFADELVGAQDPVPAPSVLEAVPFGNKHLLSLEALVRMKLVAWRRKDQTHLDDMIQAGLIDPSWPAKYPEPLAEKLQFLLDNPE